VDDFNPINERTPHICDLSPGGKYVAKTIRMQAAHAFSRNVSSMRVSFTATRSPSPARPLLKRHARRRDA